MDLSAVSTTDLLAELARRHGVSTKRAELERRTVQKRTRQAFLDGWTNELSVLLLVHALQHAADCGNPECERCEEILRRLEEPDLLSTMTAAAELERFMMIEATAAAFIKTLDAADADRGRRARSLAAELRSLVEQKEDLVTRSKFTRQERRAIGLESINMNKAQVQRLAADHGVSEAAVYKYRKELVEGGADAIEAARLDLPMPEDDDDVTRLNDENRQLKAKLKKLNEAVGHLTVEVLRYKNFVKDHYAVVTHIQPRAELEG